MEQFFKTACTQSRLRQCQLGAHLDSYAQCLSDRGYNAKYAILQIKVIADFSRWIEKKGIQTHEITSEHASSYIQYRDRKGLSQRRSAIAALKLCFFLLREKGVFKEEIESAPTPVSKLLREFSLYLRKERGLADNTVAHYGMFARRFLSEWFADGDVDLSILSNREIVGMVQKQDSVWKARHMAMVLRSFLQYAQYEGCTKHPLSTAVPAVANWSMAALPKALPQERVELVLSKCDRETGIGKRDYAILLLLARLGLRAGEVAALSLGDIDWQAGRLNVHRKGGHQHQLPIPTDVGEALALYLRDVRPRTSNKAVFLRDHAPFRGFKGPSAVCVVAKRALEQAGIKATRKGAHILRHSLATNLLSQGASLREIGEILGHRDLQTTTIYAKVDLSSLRTLALPWPGGAHD